MAAIGEDDIYTKDGTVNIHKKPANKAKTGSWKACRFILVTECCERLAYYGMSTNLVNYLRIHLGQGNVTASNNVTNWSGTCYITPLIGAFVADSYLGRFWTIATFATIYVIGMTLLTLSASVPGLKPECNKNGCHPTSLQTATFFVAIYLIALGTGGIKPCVSSFGADQFDDNDEREKRKKSSFFNWFYLSINIGAMIASSVLVWIQMNVGWGWGFGIPAVSMAIAVAFFFLGSRLYRLQIPGGSPLTRIFQVLVASIRKYNVKVPTDKSLLYETADAESSIQGSRKLEHTDKFRCLDKAAVETDSHSSLKGVVNPWSLCTVTQVEELKSIVGLLPIWASGIVFSTVNSQMGTMFVLQGNTMNQQMGPNFKIPSASLSLFNTLSVIFWAPVYDQVIIPLARKYTRNERGFTQLQRMGIGLVIATFAMIVAGLLEVARLDYVRRNNYYDQPTIPMSIFWQVPQYFLVGCAEVFTNIGQLEFFYEQAPDAMRSLCSALALTTHAGGHYLSSALVIVVTKLTTKHGQLGWIPKENMNRGHLDYFYWLLAILSSINFFVYLLIAKRSAYLTQFAEEANAEIDQIGENALKELDEAGTRIMENIESQMQAFEESMELNKSEIEESEKRVADFEGQIEKDRNEGLLFKNLRPKTPVDKATAREETEKIRELTKKSAASVIRRNIYLALIALVILGIADASISSTFDWRKVAILGVILVGLLSQLVYEQSMLSETDKKEQEKSNQ
ncbi:UNVERIFIED_CONTAM: protein NRT1/ PTR FAMILY 8.1 [Sesamum radiatum]|uniref:Protein NRT1/ PTR FAMILY 8.1 n=1 Tax=Sesamum radiatum TaxID=300843 RepID=A0AAW2KVG2_SESRA